MTTEAVDLELPSVIKGRRKATRERAITTLDRMRTIARAEMMQRIGYISDDIINPRRQHAICQGHQACAIGSLWLADGVSILGHHHEGWLLPGVLPEEREEFVAKRPALRIALAALNDAATEYLARHPEVRPNTLHNQDMVEALFESPYWERRDQAKLRLAMLWVISSAKRRIRGA